MTATSGPGFSLMTELEGLASMAELPVVIVNAQRAGPSTGMPTKLEQSDLFHALYGGHGDFPRIVVAPGSVEDCLRQIVTPSPPEVPDAGHLPLRRVPPGWN
jgi:2-oxoglutarate ferredoxin oxidoreductase subunit alpha